VVGRVSFVLFIGLGLMVCGSACSSLPDLRFDDLDGGLVVEGGPGTEGGPPGSCVPSGSEICDDGIDNDCNGQTDCADSKCDAGFRCADVPTGWTAADFAPSTTPTCSSGTTGTDLSMAAGDGAASCTCTCAAAGGACANGNFTLNLSSEATCGVAATTGTVPKSGGNCTALGASFAVTTHAKIAPVVGPTSCTPTPVKVGPLTSGRLCQAPRFGGGCGASQVCAPRPATGFQDCITKAGKNVCPSGFSKRSSAGSSATDARTCTGCTCASPTACAGGSVSLYGNTMCKTAGGNDGAEGIGSSCAALAPDMAFTATHYMATPPTGGCGVPTAPATAGGTLTFANDRTVCCQ